MGSDEVRDLILQRYGVPKEVLVPQDGANYSSSVHSLAVAYGNMCRDIMRTLEAAFAKIIPNMVAAIQADSLSKQFRRSSCWWHCKKWERRKNGINPIRKGKP